MPPKGKKRGCRTVPPDVLSNLPENIIDVIITRLPLRDAVRTSILSKKWRYNWCRLPELTLDQALWETTNNEISPTVRFTNIIYHLLTIHEGPITKFTLSIANLGNCPKVDNLVTFLSRNGIQHLVLEFPEDEPYKLPSSFFACWQIRNLSLHNCLLAPPSTFKGFHKLVNLELRKVTISSKVLGSLLSSTPLLEHLALEISSISSLLQIKAPKLRSFDFTGRIKFISLKDVPLLAHLSLVDTYYEDVGKHGIAEFLDSFPALERLHLNYHSVWFLAGPADIPTKLSSPLNCLKRLCLSGFCPEEFVELSFALCLMRSSPYLQDIHMKIGYEESGNFIDPVPGDAVNEIPASFTDATLNHLKAVRLEGIAGKKTEMQIIKILLDKSPMLVRMLIEHAPEVKSLETRVELLTEITQFRRASPKAEVVYRVLA